MAILKFKDENNNFIPIVQDVKVNNSSTFDGKDANINIKTINNQSILGEGNIEIQGGGSSDYEELENLPKVNDVELKGNKSLSDLGIENYDDTQIKQDIVNLQNNKANTSDVPTQLSQLTDDETHRVVTDTEKATWNNKSDFSGNYSALSGIPKINVKKTQYNETTKAIEIVPEDVEINGTQNLEHYGLTDVYLVDLSNYTNKSPFDPHLHLPTTGWYYVSGEGHMELGSYTYTCPIGMILRWIPDGQELDIYGYNCAEYHYWDAEKEEWGGGYFTTLEDVDYEIESKLGWEVKSNGTGTGTINFVDKQWMRKYRNSGVTRLTLTFPEDFGTGDGVYNYQSKLSCKTASSFSAFTITDRDYDIYFYGDDCANGVLTGVGNKYYEIEARHDGNDGVIVEVHSHTIPTT